MEQMCENNSHDPKRGSQWGAGLRGGEKLAGGDGRFWPRHRHAGRSKAKASARRVQAGGAGPESGAEPHARPGQEWRRPRGGGAGQQWAGCGTAGRPGRGGVGEPVHRARPARGQRGSWKDTAMQLPGRPARRTGAWTQARGRHPWGTSRPCRCQAQPSSRREGARPAVATCRTPSLHPQLQPRPSPPARPGLRCPPQAQVSPAGCHESRPAEGEADRLSDAVSCPSDNRSVLPERTRSHPFVLRLSGEHKGQAGCRRRSRSRPQSRASRRCAATTGLCGQGQDPSSPQLQMPQAMEPRQAHLTSVLAGDPAHSFPELRQHLQVRHDRGLQLQRERWGCCDWCPICEGQSLAHAPQGGAANGHVSPSNTGPTGMGAPAWRHGQDSKRVPPQWPGLRHPGGSAVLGPGQQGVLAREGFTHTEAGPSSSDGETQGALLFYGPEDLGKEASVQDVRLRQQAGTTSARGGRQCLRRRPWWGGS